MKKVFYAGLFLLFLTSGIGGCFVDDLLYEGPCEDACTTYYNLCSIDERYTDYFAIYSRSRFIPMCTDQCIDNASLDGGDTDCVDRAATCEELEACK
ncbi:MAG: hypothetical protein GY754_16460 [bacterium]|nr:hypothetical protein [bacterium]